MLLPLIAGLLITPNAEVVLGFELNLATRHATTILEAEIVDRSGRLAVKEVYMGNPQSPYIQVDAFNDPTSFPTAGFIPGPDLTGQKCIIFLKERNNGFVPACRFSDTYSGLGHSIVWVINDSIWYGRRGEYLGTPVFASNSDKKSFTDYLRMYKRSKDALLEARKVDKKDRPALLKESLAWTVLRDPTIIEIGRCGEDGINTLRDMLPRDTYAYEHMLILEVFAEAGKNAVLPEIDSIYQREFEYWKSNVKALEHPSGWQSVLSRRYSYLLEAVYILTQNKAPGWKEKDADVKAFFKDAPIHAVPPGRIRYYDERDKLDNMWGRY